MPLLYIVLALVGAGVALYLIERYIPMDPFIKRCVQVVVICVVVVWLLKVTGLWNAMMSIHT